MRAIGANFYARADAQFSPRIRRLYSAVVIAVA
jgi:hypothetical protein